MGASSCRVSYIDGQGIKHAVEVQAESLYEAVALAVAEFRQDNVNTSEPAMMTEFTVTVLRKPTEHNIRLKQVQDWAKHSVSDGPAGILKRERVRKLLNGGS